MNDDTPKYVFFHLMMFLMLYMGVVSFLALVFQYADVLFPDRLDFVYTAAFEQVRFSGSILAITFPVFLGIAWMLDKEMRLNPEKRRSRIRRWLTALTLFVAAFTIIIDLITLVYTFWGGGLTARFFLKTALVLFVAGGVFGYFGWDLRRDALKKTSLLKFITMGSGILVLMTIIVGFFIVGTPQEQRARRFDEQRVQDLQSIQYNIINYWQTKETLPENLGAIEELYAFPMSKDPDTGISYEYQILGGLSFELCATFEKSNKEFAERVKQNAPRVYDPTWVHDTGRVCFSKTIDPDLYPLTEKPYPASLEGRPVPARPY